jgi:hypothetical protein
VAGSGFELYGHADRVLGLDVLLEESAVRSLGCTVLSGLSANTFIPSITGYGPTPPRFLGENDAADDATLGTTNIAMVPHRISSITTCSKQLLIQGNPIQEIIIRNLARLFASTIDYMALMGRGIAFNEPLGVFAAPNSINVPIAAGDLYPQLNEISAMIEEERVDMNSYGIITSPNLRNILQTAPKFPGGSEDTWTGLGAARSTSQLIGVDRCFAGSWVNCVLASWGLGFSVILDVFTLARSARVNIICDLYCDVGLRHARAFAFTDEIVAP